MGADFGDAESLTEKGWCKEMGHGTSVDIEAAMKFYTLGAEAGSARGVRNVGYHCLHGNACPTNWPRAARHFLKARSFGARVSYDLAYMYENGIGGLERNLTELIILLKEGYVAGDVMSTFCLARCYFFGIGVKTDIAKTIALYTEMKDMGPYATRLHGYLGLCFVRGIGVRKNVRAGLQMIRQGLTEGSSISWAIYGHCYRHGYGVKKDAETAIRPHPALMAFLVFLMHSRACRDEREGVPHSKQRAAHHFISEAYHMHRQAASYLESGTGVGVHLHRAFFFYVLSSRGGHFAARRKASEMYRKGFGVQRNRMGAIQLLEQAVERGDEQARRLLRRGLVRLFLDLRRRKSA